MQPDVSVVQMGAHPRPMERGWAEEEAPSAHFRMPVVATQVPQLTAQTLVIPNLKSLAS